MAWRVELTGLGRFLSKHAALDDADVDAVMTLPTTKRVVQRGVHLLREGDRCSTCLVLVAGFAARTKAARNGGRSITSIHLPGEALDFQNLYVDRSDYGIEALTEAELAIVPATAVRHLLATRPAVAEAVFRAAIVEASIYREWLLNNGRRDAGVRLAHFLCELAARLDARGSAHEGRYLFPVTQEQIADAIGITAVHVNRMIRNLERDGLVARDGRVLIFPDIAALRRRADFDPRYLYLNSIR